MAIKSASGILEVATKFLKEKQPDMLRKNNVVMGLAYIFKVINMHRAITQTLKAKRGKIMRTY